MYTKCVQTVPVTVVDEDFPLNLKSVTDVIRVNKMIHVYKMCIDRSFYCSICRFSLELEKCY